MRVHYPNTEIGKPFCYIDFEYHSTRQEKVHLVCASTIVIYPDNTESKIQWWLYNDESQHRNLRQYLLALDAIFISYAVTAEARAFYSLGINPLQCRWVDLLLEWKQLRNECHRWQYGWVKSKTYGWRKTNPPRYGEKESVSSEETGTSLSDAMKNLLEREIDTDHKNQMRNRIIAGGPFNEREQQAISDYCSEDTEHLPDLHAAIMSALLELIPGGAHPRLFSSQLTRGRFAADMAICEARGLPLHVPRIEAISRNHDKIAAKVIEEANAVYPFWLADKKGRYVQSYAQFDALIRRMGWQDFWPVTETKKFSTDDKVLDDFKGYPEIAALRNAKKTLQQIKWFRPNALPEFYEKVGTDARLRPYFNPYGTQTGRNAPPAKTFVLAMSAWLRCIVSPFPGTAITGRDWSSQEFAIAAALSGDENMIRAYNSGDPYMEFAKLAHGVPENATRKTHEAERELFKSTCLEEGTPIRVRGKGFVPIEKVLKGDFVWDGDSWRECDGSIYNGIRSVVSVNGIFSTEDHCFMITRRQGNASIQQWNTVEEIKMQNNGKIPEEIFTRFRRASSSWSDVWSLACSIVKYSLIRKI